MREVRVRLEVKYKTGGYFNIYRLEVKYKTGGYFNI